MSPDLEVAISQARVGLASLRQHEVLLFAPENTLVVLTALSAPRLWGSLLDAAAAGFSEGLGRTHDGRTSTRLHQAVDSTQKRMRTLAENLIERRMPDVGVLALAREGRLLHVLSAGPGRAYLYRRRAMRRLSPRDDRAEGVLKAGPAWCAEELEQGDLVLAGSISAFGEASVAALRSRLESGGAPSSTRALVEDLNRPAATLGIGAAAVAFHISNF